MEKTASKEYKSLTGEAGRHFFMYGARAMGEPTESSNTSLILQQKWEDLSVYLFSCVLRDMPKNDRFTLGADMRALVWEVEAALVQISLRAGNRWQLLNTVDVQAKVLLSMVRLGIRIGSIPEKRYESVSEKLVEIGRMVGGLKKAGR